MRKHARGLNMWATRTFVPQRSHTLDMKYGRKGRKSVPLTSSFVFFFSTENHRTQTSYEDALIIKLFGFQFVNSYTSLFYIAFFRQVQCCVRSLCWLKY